MNGSKSGQLCVVSMHQTAQSSQKCFLLNYKKNRFGGQHNWIPNIFYWMERVDGGRREDLNTQYLAKWFLLRTSCINGIGRKLIEIIHNEHHHFTPILLCRSQFIHFYELLLMWSIDRPLYHIFGSESNEILKTKNFGWNRDICRHFSFFRFSWLPNIWNEKLS